MSIQEYVRQIVDKAPPLTFDQANRIAVLFNPGVSKDLTPPPETARQKEHREAQKALGKIQKEYREALESCGICQLSKVAHNVQSRHSMGYHEFDPMNVDQIIKISESYKPKIQAAEDRLAAAK